MIVHMTVVRINAITVPADSGDELARRFAARAGAVDNQDGFEGFELLKPTDGRARASFGGRAGGRPGAALGRHQQRTVVLRSRRRILRLMAQAGVRTVSDGSAVRMSPGSLVTTAGPRSRARLAP